MTALVTVLRALVRLFVDDGSLALAIIAVILLAAAAMALAPGWPIAAGVVLLSGCVTVLFVNVVTAARQRKPTAERKTE
jgi:hypothetical protein